MKRAYLKTFIPTLGYPIHIVKSDRLFIVLSIMTFSVIYYLFDMPKLEKIFYLVIPKLQTPIMCTTKSQTNITTIRENTKTLLNNPKKFFRNPFLNFLRDFRKSHKNRLDMVEITRRGAQLWRLMNTREKSPYINQTKKAPKIRKKSPVPVRKRKTLVKTRRAKRVPSFCSYNSSIQSNSRVSSVSINSSKCSFKNKKKKTS